jgi:site-specific recombinase XerD
MRVTLRHANVCIAQNFSHGYKFLTTVRKPRSATVTEISQLKVWNLRQEGTRTGNWLAKPQAQQLLNTPDINTLKGLRDRAILALLLGCGLRRAEAANLTFDHIQQRDGRWVLVDLLGKRNKLRSIPMPAWTKVAIDEYAAGAGLKEEIVFRGQSTKEDVSPATA